MARYPQPIVPVDHVEPVPRRVRAVLNGRTVLDTTRAVYLWEWPNYPQYYIPAADLDPAAVVDEDHVQQAQTRQRPPHRPAGRRPGPPRRRPDLHRRPGRGPRAAASNGTRSTRGSRRTSRSSSTPATRTPRRRAALHPYRADRARRGGPRRVVLAGDGLRDRPADALLPQPDRRRLHPPGGVTDTAPRARTRARTSDYWSVRTGEAVHQDLAWAYDFPTAALLPIAGLVASTTRRSTCSSTASSRTGP